MNEKSGTFEKIKNYLSNSITLKLAVIGFLLILMGIPISEVKSLIRERNIYMNEATNNIKSSWGRSQMVTGPELTIPYQIKTSKALADGTVTTKMVKKYRHFLPEELNIDGNIAKDTLYRGMYKVPVYSAGLNLSGFFKLPEMTINSDKQVEILWNEAFFTLGLSDQKRVNSKGAEMYVNGEAYSFETGASHSEIVDRGLKLPYRIEDQKKDIQFSINLNINGSDELLFLPVGQETTVNLESDWGNPSFQGSFLPINDESKIITDDHFEASWKVFHLNRDIPKVYEELDDDYSHYSFGVNFFEPVNRYTKTTRSVKYAMLFISLTFLSFFFLQIINKLRIHPFQYVLVGLALSIFYLLLLSLSEHLGFDLAYLIASAGIIIQISLYVKSMFKTIKSTILMAGLLIFLYGFIYVIIQLTDHSLLIGSIGLFLILGLLMYASRKINWSFGTEKQLETVS